MEEEITTNSLGQSNEVQLDSSLHKKIIIVGGGMAGLSCASHLYHLGFKNVTILEARDRIGGRIDTKYFGSNFIEMGAQWIHGEDGNAIYQLAKAHNLVNYSLPSYIDAIFKFSDIAKENECKALQSMVQFLEEKTENISAHIFNNDVSYSNYLDDIFHSFLFKLKPKDNLKMLLIKCYKWYCTLLCELNGCCDLNHLSTKMNYRECKGLQTVELNSGYATVVNVITKSFPPEWVLMNKFVTLVDWTHFCIKQEPSSSNKNLLNCEGCKEKLCSVTVHCNNGETYKADHVIITIPLGCLKKYAQSMFSPELPFSKSLAINCIGYDAVNKVYLEFKEPFWKEGSIYNNFSVCEGLSKRDTDDYWVNYINRFAYTPRHPNMLCAWVVGRGAELVEKLSDQEVLSDCIATIETNIQKLKSKPLNIFRSSWKSDPLSCGSYSYLSMKCQEEAISNEDLAEPLYAGYSHNSKPIILFAGEATHPYFYSTVHGAYESGIREATRLSRYYRYHTFLLSKLHGLFFQ